MNDFEEQERIEAYSKGLIAMWQAAPTAETQKRYSGFVEAPRLSRLNWIRWVERQAEAGSPDWCVELVGMTVAAKIGAV